MIRRAAADDLVSIEAFDIFAGDRRREMDERRMLVADDAGAVVAYLSWAPAGFVGRDYITYLCVRPGRRRQGLALSMLHAVEKRIATGRLFISTEEDNVPMLTLLAREGWTHAGAVAGANEGERAEVFFYKDLS